MNVALFLREKILKLRENKLPNPITVEAIQMVSVQIYLMSSIVIFYIGFCTLAQNMKLIIGSGISDHQLKMIYTKLLVGQ